MDYCFVHIKDAFESAGLPKKNSKSAEALYNSLKRVIELESSDPKYAGLSVDENIARLLKEQVDVLIREKMEKEAELILNESAYNKMVDWVEKTVEQRFAAGERSSFTLGFTKKTKKQLYVDVVKDYLQKSANNQDLRIKDLQNDLGRTAQINDSGWRKATNSVNNLALYEYIRTGKGNLDPDLKAVGDEMIRISKTRDARLKELGIKTSNDGYSISQSRLLNMRGAHVIAKDLKSYRQNIGKLFDQHADKTKTLKNLRIYPDDNQTWDDVWNQFLDQLASDAWYGKNESWSRYPTAKTPIEKALSRLNKGERLFEFKTIKDEMAFMEANNPVYDYVDQIATKFGKSAKKSLVQIYIEEMIYQTKQISTITDLGTKPKSTFDLFRKYMGSNYKLEEFAESFQNKNVFQMDAMLNVLTGVNNVPANITLAETTALVKALNNLTQLGGAVVASFSDVISGMAESSRLGGPMNQIANTIRNMPDEAKLYLREYAEGQRMEAWNRFGDMSNGLGGKTDVIQDIFFKATFLTGWTNMNNRSFSRTLSSYLSDISSKNYADLDKGLLWQFTKSNIGEGDWDFIRSNFVREIEGKKYLVPMMEDELIGNPELRLMNEKLENFIVNSQTRAVPQPSLRQKGLSESIQAGTTYGSLQRLFFQFKSFPLKMAEILQFDLENPMAKSKFKTLSISIMGMTAVGLLTIQTKDLIAGKGYKPLEEYEFEDWRKVMAQGGAFGILGDFAINMFGEPQRIPGTSPLGNILGPTFGRVERLSNSTTKALSGEFGGGEAINLAKSYVPGSNIWWATYATNAVVFNHLQEMANPGYLARMEAKAVQEGRIGTLPQTFQ